MNPWTELVYLLREDLAMALIGLTMRVLPRGSWLGTQYAVMVKLLFETHSRRIQQVEAQRRLQAEWKRKIESAK
ncbi:MAG TPA: hypothetical protein VM531_11265 [Sphingomicrobium sp.]|jgi:hypothetical protein|nr:hypothetical protein [Sphingomicrobium sp.]